MNLQWIKPIHSNLSALQNKNCCNNEDQNDYNVLPHVHKVWEELFVSVFEFRHPDEIFG